MVVSGSLGSQGTCQTAASGSHNDLESHCCVHDRGVGQTLPVSSIGVPVPPLPFHFQNSLLSLGSAALQV